MFSSSLRVRGRFLVLVYGMEKCLVLVYGVGVGVLFWFTR